MANTGNTQQQINYGAAVNDGNGDPLRTAFIKTDDNFDNVWLAGPVGSNITITNNTVQVNNTNGNLILSPNGTGVIQTNSRLLPRLNNTYDFGSTTLKYRTGYFGTGGLVIDGNVTVAGNLTAGNISYTGNVFVGDLQGSVYADDSTIMVDAVDNELFAGRATISGNVSATYFIGNGSQLTGLAATYGNSNVAAYLPTYIGNLAGGNLNITGNTATTGNVAGGNLITGGRVFAAGNIVSTGNVSGSYFIGNGSLLTGIASSYGNSNVAAYLPTYTGQLAGNQLNITRSGNSWSMTNGALTFPTGAFWYSNISSNDEYISSNVDGYLNFQTFDSTSNLATELHMEHGLVHISIYNGSLKQWEFNEDGTTHLPGDLLPQANLGGNLGNQQYQWNDLWVSNNTIYLNSVPLTLSAGNVLTVDGNAVLTNNSNTTVSTTGNVTASYFFGSGSQLTGLPAPTVTQDITSNGAMSIMTYDGVIKYVSYATVEPSSGNITSGNILTSGLISAAGNISGNYFVGNGSQLTGINSGVQSSIANGTSNVDIATANGNVTISANAETYTFGTNSTLTLPGGSRLRPLGANLDIFAGTGSYVNLITSDESSSMGVGGAGGYVVTAGGTWNFNTSGNLTAPGNISAVGNITSGNITVGSGTITGGNVNGATFNGNVAFGTGTVGGSGNITGGNLITTGSGGDITMSGGNITGVGNISAGNVSTTGNVAAANFLGNGASMTGVATKVNGSWTVTAGTNNYSFTVPINNTYQLWVLGNIPNGIIVYNATVSVSNTNVPVVGQQFAWNYEGGGNILMFTSIPAQIVGTAGTISNAAPAVANTNVFTFGINNTSGNTVTVNYGYTKIS